MGGSVTAPHPATSANAPASGRTFTLSQTNGRGYLDKPTPGSLTDVVELLLDKGIVIDASVRVSALGLDLLSLDARIVVASADTYLRFAEAARRHDLSERGGADVTDLAEATAGPALERTARTVVKRKIDHVVDRVTDLLPGD